MVRRLLKRVIPSWQNAILALLSAGLLIFAFPDLEFWFLAWFALVPLMWGVEREQGFVRSFFLGWLFGTAFFFGTCWWLTYAPIHYGAFPWPLAYGLILIACLGAGVFPGVFAAFLSVLLRRFGWWAFLAAPFVWVFSEFARYWLTGNNWNAIGYSQAFGGIGAKIILRTAESGGVLLSSGYLAFFNSLLCAAAFMIFKSQTRTSRERTRTAVLLLSAMPATCAILLFWQLLWESPDGEILRPRPVARIIAIQPNVPMSGLDQTKLEHLRARQMQMAEGEVTLSRKPRLLKPGELTVEGPPPPPRVPTLVILPESPMNFLYTEDREFQQFARDFTTTNDVSLLFNSAEPDDQTTKFFNSAVMVGPDGKKVAEYDKVYLLPFGEAVPVPFDSVMPGFVGNFAYGRNYPLLPVGDVKAGVMICFESHFGALSREYVKNGADVIIEMTNDGYLGPTPVLRQHLANAVFRAVETKRPVLRVTNVGITARINQFGFVDDPAPTYAEATRVWTVWRSDGSQTLYVRYGDWFAWLCTIVTFGLLLYCLRSRKAETRAVASVP